MARRDDRSAEIRKLASVLYHLMREHEIASHKRLKITPSLARIIKLAPEWRALRRRGETEDTTRAAKEPSFFTLLDFANELGVPICTFAPTITHQPLTPEQRHFLTMAARWTLGSFAERDDERGAYTSDFEDFRPYVTFEKLEYESRVGRVGADEQLPPERIDVLASIPGIAAERMQVTTVRGRSMADLLLPGDRIVVDTHRRKPHDREIVVVDRAHLGRTIGYWRSDGTHYFLEKENEPTIDLGSPGDFTLLGTVTGLAWRPLGRKPLITN